MAPRYVRSRRLFASEAIFAFSDLSILRLVLFVMVRAIGQTGRLLSGLTPGAKFGGPFQLLAWHAVLRRRGACLKINLTFRQQIFYY